MAGRSADPTVPPAEARTVAEHVITEVARLGVRLDLRLYYNRAIPAYVQWADDETESDWRDLVTASIEEHLVEVRHQAEQKTRDERKGSEVEIMRAILSEHAARKDQVEAWKKRTGKSSRAFYRRMAEVT